MASESYENEFIPQWKKDLIQRKRQLKNNIFLCNKNQNNTNCGSTSNLKINGGDTCECLNNKKTNVLECQKEEEIKRSSVSVSIDDVSGRNEWELKSTFATVASDTNTNNSTCLSCLDSIKNSVKHSFNCKMRLDVEYCDESSKLIPKNVAKCMTNNMYCLKNILDAKSTPNANENNDEFNEELEYGPGIVKKLKSKYLNLTLHQNEPLKRDIIKIRRATSLENLLESEQCENNESNFNHFTKKVSSFHFNNSSNIKNQHLKNGLRMKERMKRARSVETLIRFQSITDESVNENRKSFINPINFNQDVFVIEKSNNLKIECKLGSGEDDHELRPKVINKPKRLKPVLDDTERPPPDVVKMNLRIFEGSIKKIKPKGDIAAKVATFKIINDSNKVSNIKKKPPIQPKTFLNTKLSTKTNQFLHKQPSLSINIGLKPINKSDSTNSEDIKCQDGVDTEPIVQCVSLVVSKFQQIEKSLSPISTPTSTPTPSLDQFKICKSPSASPEPSDVKLKTQLKSVSIHKEEIIISTQHFLDSDNFQCLNNKDDEENKKGIGITSEFQDTKEVAHSFDYQQPHSSDRVDGHKKIDKKVLENISKAGSTFEFEFADDSIAKKKYLPTIKNSDSFNKFEQAKVKHTELPEGHQKSLNKVDQHEITSETKEVSPNSNSLVPKLIKSVVKTNDNQPQKQIGIIRPLQSTQSQLSHREIEKNLINKVKSIETSTKVLVNLNRSESENIKVPTKKENENIGNAGITLWDSKPYNQQSNTMVFNFSNRKDVPDYIENDGIIIRRRKDKSKINEGGIIVLDATLDASTTDDIDWESSGGPPSPCDVSFLNDNIIINGKSNLSKSPKNHKLRIQFDDNATRTFEYPSEITVLEDESVIGNADMSDGTGNSHLINKSENLNIKSKHGTHGTNPILSGGGLSNFTPSKVDLVSECFELGVTRSSTTKIVEQCNQQLLISSQVQIQEIQASEPIISTDSDDHKGISTLPESGNTCWGSEPTADILY